MRTGKIARLPRTLRDQLNHRLADGEVGSHLVTWLNSLPEVRHVLDTHFGGRPISEQNLSEWRQGGFEEWLRQEDACAWVTQLVEDSDELETTSGNLPLAERAIYPAILALSGLLRRDLVSADPAEQRRSVVSAAQQLTQLRRVCLQAERLRFERERWAAEQAEIRRRAERQAELLRLEQERQRLLHEEIRQEAQFRAKIASEFHPANVFESPLESDQIKPNPTSEFPLPTPASSPARQSPSAATPLRRERASGNARSHGHPRTGQQHTVRPHRHRSSHQTRKKPSPSKRPSTRTPAGARFRYRGTSGA